MIKVGNFVLLVLKLIFIHGMQFRNVIGVKIYIYSWDAIKKRKQIWIQKKIIENLRYKSDHQLKNCFFLYVVRASQRVAPLIWNQEWS